MDKGKYHFACIEQKQYFVANLAYRSLIALALILSLLQFKPAPMYILDEVDAALDPSHTQNIGLLLRTRFKGSQFIIVSLKDGMFNNANVLFKTKFRDGVSTVEVRIFVKRFSHEQSIGRFLIMFDLLAGGST